MKEGIQLYPKFKEKPPEIRKVIESIKDPMLGIVKQMKLKIEAGYYDCIVSDESGGRIPSLILYETFKKINPSKDVKILFFSGGHKLRDLGDEKKHMVDTFLTEHIKPGSNILVSSQYAHSGKTLNLIGESLEKLGFSHIDVSVMCDNGGWAEIDKDIFDDVFIGEIENHDQLELNEHSHVISGIIKSREYQVVPMRLDKYIDQGGGRDAVITSTEYASFFDPNEYDTIQERRIKSKDESNIKNYEDSMKIKLLPEEKTQIQENIKIARQEIHKVVDKIIHEL